MRILAAVACLFVVGRAEETRAPEHDPLGFPITFNEDIITRNDIRRGGARPVNQSQWKEFRDQALMTRVVERLAQQHGIEVSDRDVDNAIRRQIDIHKGAAKFFEWLDQRDDTLESYKETVRLEILHVSVNQMLARGMTPDRKMLPWSLFPTPHEVEIAFRNDPERKAAGPKVRFVELVVAVDKKTRSRLVGEQFRLEESDAWFQEQIRAALQPKLDRVLADLKRGKTIDEVAAFLGQDIEAQKGTWRMLPKEAAGDPAGRFLQTARAGDHSPPLSRTPGRCRILYLVEVKRLGKQGLEVAEVYRGYRIRIATLRTRKAEAILKLKALDSSTVRPIRVRDEFRGVLLAALKDAEFQLRRLGLH